jgi:glucose/arabinose dehydrogenase
MTLSSGTGRANRTTLVRGVYDGTQVKDIQTLFQVNIDKSGGAHFGSRLLWLPDGTLLMSIGDGGNPPTRVGDRLAREQAQNVASHQGSILRLDGNGKAAPGNPFVGQEGALPELWSIGHRNIQGLTKDPQNRIWATEHGPRGGDELNVVEAGKNYGWPVVSLGGDYRTGEPVGAPTQAGMVDPIIAWTPSPGASGLTFYSGDKFPDWKGSLFSGGLASRDVRRVIFDADGKVVKQESLRIGRRVRDVRQGPDGYLYLLTDEQDGELLRVVPQNAG